MKTLFFFLFIGLNASCAGFRLTHSGDVSLNTVQSFRPGVTTAAELREILGSPDSVLSAGPDETLWVYDGAPASHSFQRASFVLDATKGILLTALWIPNEQDPESWKEQVISRFGSASFRVKDVGWIAGHEYSPEEDYEDLAIGVGMRVNRDTRRVAMISFFPATPRKLADGS